MSVSSKSFIIYSTRRLIINISVSIDIINTNGLNDFIVINANSAITIINGANGVIIVISMRWTFIWHKASKNLPSPQGTQPTGHELDTMSMWSLISESQFILSDFNSHGQHWGARADERRA